MDFRQKTVLEKVCPGYLEVVDILVIFIISNKYCKISFYSSFPLVDIDHKTKNYKIMRKCLTLLFVSILLWSCSEAQFEDTADVSAPVLSAEIIDDTPYPLEIMRQAVNEVMAESATRSTVPELKPTHRYIEFIPATFEEYYRLWGEENIDCIPASALDTSNLMEENSCVAVIRKENEGPEKLYALVANDVTLPDYIAYKVLTELYTPYAADSGITNVELSKQITQRAEMLSNETRGIIVPVKKVTPKGTITVADKYAGKNVPLANVSVTIIYKAPAGDFDVVTTEVVKTDGNGYFTSAKSYDERYISFSIAWVQGRISITDSSGNVATTIGGSPDSSGQWNPVFGEPEFTPSMINYYVSMYRAVNSVFNGGTDVLSNNNHYIQLCATDEAGTGNSATSFAPDSSTGLYPKAIIKCGNKDSYEIMHYTCYELGRMCMYAINPKRYITSWAHTHTGRNETIKRSWGAFAAFYFLGKEAERVGTVEKLHTMITYNGNKVQKPDFYNRQDWQCTYTVKDLYHIPISINIPIFIDLYDSFNQYEYYSYTTHFSNTKYPNDNICMPDFSTIRDIAYGANSINDVYVRIKDPKYKERYLYTEEDINTLFNSWDTYGLYTFMEEICQWPEGNI